MRPPYFYFSITLLAALVLGELQPPAQAQRTPKPPKDWEAKIVALEKKDDVENPPRNGIVFVGSSSIRKWDLAKSFPDLPAINRGFGGSRIADTGKHLQRLVLKHRPQIMVFYAGDNDINDGVSIKQVVCDFCCVHCEVRKHLPQTRLVFIAIKPSIKRWELYPQMAEANRRIKSIADKDPRIDFVDIANPMLGENGRPRQELFAKDDLHLSEAGYELWTRLLRPFLTLKP
jgi:lysophospholipase L1-like esterase